ncbi:MAG: P-II family nitrogen regulator [Mariniblastus sp.]
MKQIVAIVKPFLAEKVIESVAGELIEELSIREVKGFGRQKNYLDQYGENEYSLAFVPKVEISIWAANENVESIIDQIVSVSRTGRLGDGKIMVLPVISPISDVC